MKVLLLALVISSSYASKISFTVKQVPYAHKSFAKTRHGLSFMAIYQKLQDIGCENIDIKSEFEKNKYGWIKQFKWRGQYEVKADCSDKVEKLTAVEEDSITSKVMIVQNGVKSPFLTDKELNPRHY